jgi:NCAIR mutase (PurE)-related protein
MDPKRIEELLAAVASGEVQPGEAFHRLRDLPYEDLGFAKVDHHRTLRKGYPETIFCAGKTPEQVVAIAERMKAQGNVLGTRCSAEVMAAVMAAHPEAEAHELARTFTIMNAPPEVMAGYVAVVCAGTSDLPVAEEAAVTLETMGNRVVRICDVGVAGIHRLFAQRDVLSGANALVECDCRAGARAGDWRADECGLWGGLWGNCRAAGNVELVRERADGGKHRQWFWSGLRRDRH